MTTSSASTNRSDAQPDAASSPEPGRYRHYKGGEYQVIDIARHSETEEWLVIYRPLYGDAGLWARPLAMFMESVEVDGQHLPRFARIAD